VTSRAPTGLPFTVRWATDTTNTGSTWDVQYRIGFGKWRGWKFDISNFKGVFGRHDKPVTVKKGKRYSFRVRSRKGASASRWSPRASFMP
jgi:hypothetical protein